MGNPVVFGENAYFVHEENFPGILVHANTFDVSKSPIRLYHFPGFKKTYPAPINYRILGAGPLNETGKESDALMQSTYETLVTLSRENMYVNSARITRESGIPDASQEQPFLWTSPNDNLSLMAANFGNFMNHERFTGGNYEIPKRIHKVTEEYCKDSVFDLLFNNTANVIAVCEASAFEDGSPMLPHIREAGWIHETYTGSRKRRNSQGQLVTDTAPTLAVAVRTATPAYYASQDRDEDYAGKVKIAVSYTHLRAHET